MRHDFSQQPAAKPIVPWMGGKRKLARRIKMAVSVNDHPEMRRAFAGLETADLPVKYSVRDGRDGCRPASRELLIRNFSG
jgi:hypothetical protein